VVGIVDSRGERFYGHIHQETEGIIRILVKSALVLQPDGPAQISRRERAPLPMHGQDGIPFDNGISHCKWHNDQAFSLFGQFYQCRHVILAYRLRLSRVQKDLCRRERQCRRNRGLRNRFLVPIGR
jgi:hypothetical protein